MRFFCRYFAFTALVFSTGFALASKTQARKPPDPACLRGLQTPLFPISLEDSVRAGDLKKESTFLYLGIGSLSVSEPKEIASARLFSNAMGLNTALVSKFEVTTASGDRKELYVPAFDGVLFDKNGFPIANLSLKTVSNQRSICKALKGVLREATSKIVQFSADENWAVFEKFDKGRIRAPGGPFAKIKTFFGINSQRPPRSAMVVVDYTHALAPSKISIFNGKIMFHHRDNLTFQCEEALEIAELQRLLTRHEDELDLDMSLVLLGASSMLTVNKAGYHHTPLDTNHQK